MRAMQGTWPRVKKRLPSDAGIRGLMIKCGVLLHNYRTSKIGINKIATVFDPEYENFVNIENYDRIHRYFVN